MYALLRKALFQLDPETSHHLTLSLLPLIAWLMPRAPSDRALQVKCMGLKFPNPVGLAAGLDKDGVAVSAWPKLGFGFMEVGTVTPLPQPGNPKPRLFRLIEDQAIINRMGFNNQGVEGLIKRLQHFKNPCPIGINIGKNRDTDLIDAHLDYARAFQAVYPYADYVTVNISSPNTPGLKSLQHGSHLNSIMQSLMEMQEKMRGQFTRKVPIAVKISPDLTEEELDNIITALMQWNIDAIIATNTTVTRPSTLKSRYKTETGGLSGAPLFEAATQSVSQIADLTQGNVPIIAVGGIRTVEDAKAKFQAGASLIQLYSGFIYEGPKLIHAILRALKSAPV